MRTVEERVSSLEAKVDGIGELRADMNRQFGEFREDMTRLREDMNRQFGEFREDMTRLREDMNRQFTETRQDMNRQLAEGREDMNRRFEQVDGWLERLDRRSDRQFMWVVGIQFALFISVIAALLRAATS